jgi:hypothetical protein
MPSNTDPNGCNNPDHAGLRRILITDVVVGDDTLGQDVAAVHHIIHGQREQIADLMRYVRRERLVRSGAGWFTPFVMGAGCVLAVIFLFFGK